MSAIISITLPIPSLPPSFAIAPFCIHRTSQSCLVSRFLLLVIYITNLILRFLLPFTNIIYTRKVKLIVNLLVHVILHAIIP